MPKQIQVQIKHDENGLPIYPPSVDGLISMANSAANVSNNPHAAEQIRDENGKLIQVRVNLPFDVSQGNLENAAAALNENRGVAVATIVASTAQLTMTGPSGAAANQGDYIILENPNDITDPLIIWLAKDGNNTQPTGNDYVSNSGSSRAAKVAILSTDTENQVMDKLLAAATGPSSALTGAPLSDVLGTFGIWTYTRSNATLNISYVLPGNRYIAVHNSDDSGTGSFTLTVIEPGVSA